MEVAAAAPAKKEEKKEEVVVVVDDPATVVKKSLEKQIGVIERAVESSQQRLMMRVLRHNAPIRKNVSPKTLAAVIRAYLPESETATKALQCLDALPESGAVAMEEDVVVQGEPESKGDDVVEEEQATLVTETPEIEVYLGLLALCVLCRESRFESAAELGGLMVDRLRTLAARRMVDPLSAKVYSLFAVSHEKLGSFESTQVRGTLLAAHRTACLRHNEFGQATLLNLLLRALLAQQQVEAAFKLVSKTKFPETASHNQYCRYLYYTGRIQALRLDYTDAHTKLTQSMRKAPSSGATAGAFKRSVQKLTVLVQLLMGELPERSMFTQGQQDTGEKSGTTSANNNLKAMAPYLELTRAVRVGSLLDYNRVVAERRSVFAKDGTETLVERLSQNVVKTGLRRLNTSYSRISLEDIKVALELDSRSSAEFVAAKAIADGVIDAVLDHDNGYMRSSELADLYATNEPQKAFHRRIAFCLDVHNEAVKAMVYPPIEKKTDEDDAPKDDEAKTAEEVAKEIEDELSEEGMD